jgi:hypothetical protein
MASGINNTFRQVGIATGIAGLGAVFQHDITRKTTAALAEVAAGRSVLGAVHGRLGPALVSGEIHQLARSLPPSARDALTHAYRVGFTESLTSLLLIGVVIALCGAVLAFALVRSSDFVASEQAASAPAVTPVEVGAG